MSWAGKRSHGGNSSTATARPVEAFGERGENFNRLSIWLRETRQAADQPLMTRAIFENPFAPLLSLDGSLTAAMDRSSL